MALQAGQQLDPALLPDKPGRNALVSDICMLSTLYHDLLGCPAIGLRIEILRHAMCPRFHVDRTGIRMTCTYLGPGTEWIDDARIDRARLGPGANGLPDMESGLFMDETPPIEAAYLKARCGRVMAYVEQYTAPLLSLRIIPASCL